MDREKLSTAVDRSAASLADAGTWAATEATSGIAIGDVSEPGSE